MGRMKDRMLQGELYIAEDADPAADFARAQDLLERYNRSAYAAQDERDALLRAVLGSVGDEVHVRPPFHCEYGTRVSIGAKTFFNYDCLMLDDVPSR
jgi:maltose O-acetyltransferase